MIGKLQFRILLRFFLLTTISGPSAFSADISPSMSCYILTPSDLQNWQEENPLCRLSCIDPKTGVTSSWDIDVMAGGLFRIVLELEIDLSHGKLYAWAAKKSEGPGWRIFDLNTLKLITPDTPLRSIEGMEPRLRVDGDYLLLFYQDSSYSRENSGVYVFDAATLSQINAKMGIGGMGFDLIFLDNSHRHFYMISKWDDRSFPAIQRIAVPSLDLVYSIETKDLFDSHSKHISVLDIKENKGLLFAYQTVAEKVGESSSGFFAVLDLETRKIIEKGELIAGPGIESARFTQDASYFFFQSRDSTEVSLYNTDDMKVTKVFNQMGVRALMFSYIEGNDIYIYSASGHSYKHIDASTGNVVAEIPIVK
jgi:hypothetical protein